MSLKPITQEMLDELEKYPSQMKMYQTYNSETAVCFNEYYLDLLPYFSPDLIDNNPLSHSSYLPFIKECFEGALLRNLILNESNDFDLIKLANELKGYYLETLRSEFKSQIRSIISGDILETIYAIGYLKRMIFPLFSTGTDNGLLQLNRFFNFDGVFSTLNLVVDKFGNFSRIVLNAHANPDIVISKTLPPKKYLSQKLISTLRVDTINEPTIGFENPFLDIKNATLGDDTPSKLWDCVNNIFFRESADKTAIKMGVAPLFKDWKSIVEKYKRSQIKESDYRSLIKVARFRDLEIDLSPYFSKELIENLPITHLGNIENMVYTVENIEPCFLSDYIDDHTFSDTLHFRKFVEGVIISKQRENYKNEVVNFVTQDFKTVIESFGSFQKVLWATRKTKKSNYDQNLAINEFLRFDGLYSLTTNIGIASNGLFVDAVDAIRFGGHVISRNNPPKEYFRRRFSEALTIDTENIISLGFENPFIDIVNASVNGDTARRVQLCLHDKKFNELCPYLRKETSSTPPLFLKTPKRKPQTKDLKELIIERDNAIFEIGDQVVSYYKATKAKRKKEIETQVKMNIEKFKEQSDRYKKIPFGNVKFFRLFLTLNHFRCLVSNKIGLEVYFLVEGLNEDNYRSTLNRVKGDISKIEHYFDMYYNGL